MVKWVKNTLSFMKSEDFLHYNKYVWSALVMSQKKKKKWNSNLLFGGKTHSIHINEEAIKFQWGREPPGTARLVQDWLEVVTWGVRAALSLLNLEKIFLTRWSWFWSSWGSFFRRSASSFSRRTSATLRNINWKNEIPPPVTCGLVFLY